MAMTNHRALVRPAFASSPLRFVELNSRPCFHDDKSVRIRILDIYTVIRWLCEAVSGSHRIPIEFDADQLPGSPYHCAPDTLSGDQKCKLRRDANRADYLKPRSSLGLITNETGDCVSAELNDSGLHGATLGPHNTQAKLGNDHLRDLQPR